MARGLATVGAAAVVLVLLGACASDDTDASCSRGETRSCTCATGDDGTKTCKASQTGFDACTCDGADAGKAGSSGNAGEGGSAASGRSGSSAAGGGAGAAGSAAGSAGMSTTAGTGGSAGSTTTPVPELATEPTDEAAYVFDQSQLRTYNIVIAPADLTTVNNHPGAEQWVPASLELEGKSYGPYKFRYKGSTGSFKAPCTTDGPDDPKAGKCSMKLGFDEVDPDARFYGLKKLNFHAMNNDLSFLRDRLGYSLFRDSNVAAPRAVHARVLINGKLEGLFIVVEQVDGRFTRARFGEGGEGNVYKEVWTISNYTDQNYIDSLESNSDVGDVSGILDFRTAVQTSASATEMFFDRGYMMRWLAVDRVIVNDDGAMHFYCNPNGEPPNYAMGNGNFYWYQAAAAKKFWVIPWDLDLSFDGTPWVTVRPKWDDTQAACKCMTDGFGSQMPPACDPLVKHFISWHDDFDREVDKFIAGPFSDARVQAKLNAWIEQIKQVVTESVDVQGAEGVDDWTYYVDQLKDKINAQRMNRGYKY